MPRSSYRISSQDGGTFSNAIVLESKAKCVKDQIRSNNVFSSQQWVNRNNKGSVRGKRCNLLVEGAGEADSCLLPLLQWFPQADTETCTDMVLWAANIYKAYFPCLKSLKLA